MVKITVTAKYEVELSDEDMEDLTYDGKPFEECYKDNFENWRLDPEFNFEYTNKSS